MVQCYYHLKGEKMSAVALVGGRDRPACRKKGWRGSAEREERLTCWTWRMDELHSSTEHYIYSLFRFCPWDDVSRVWARYSTAGERIRARAGEPREKKTHQTPRLHFYRIYSYPTVMRNKMPTKVLVLKKYFFIITVSIFWIMHMTFG